MNTTPILYDFYTEQTYSSARTLSFEKKEPAKTTELIQKLHELNSRYNPDLPLDLSKKIEDISAATKKIQFAKEHLSSSAKKGSFFGFLGATAASALVISLSGVAVPGALLTASLLAAAATGTAFGRFFSQYAAKNTLLKEEVIAENQNNDVKDLIESKKEIITEQLKTEKSNCLEEIENLDNLIYMQYLSYSEEDQIEPNRNKKNNSEKRLEILNETIDLFNNLQ